MTVEDVKVKVTQIRSGLWVWMASIIFSRHCKHLSAMGTLQGSQVERALCCVSLRALFPRSQYECVHPDLPPTAQMFPMEDRGTRKGM